MKMEMLSHAKGNEKTSQPKVKKKAGGDLSYKR